MIKRSLLDVLLGVALTVALVVALQETGQRWYRSTTVTAVPEDIRWAALALVAVGVLVIAPVAWALVSPITTGTAGILLAAAVWPGLFQVSIPPERVSDYLLQLETWPTTYLAIGVLIAASWRPHALFRRLRLRRGHTGLTSPRPHEN